MKTRRITGLRFFITSETGGTSPWVVSKKLHLMNITRLFNNIARIRGDVEAKEDSSTEQMDLLGKQLHQYVNAIRDYEYITSLSPLPGFQDIETRYVFGQEFIESFPHGSIEPCNTKYYSLKKKDVEPRDRLRKLLVKFLPSSLSWTDKEKGKRGSEFKMGMSPEIDSKFVIALSRFIVGVVGGSALIVPMVIMVLNPSLVKSLVTVSAAVTIFALVLGLVFETGNQDTITATATYAAVLVVFVGTSGSAGA